MRQIIDQLLSLFKTMTPSQKLTLAVVTLSIPAAFFVMIWNGSSSSYVPLSYGKVFSPEEQRNAEQALKEANLTQFKSEGRQILAPRNEVERYNNALLQSGSLPANWAEELEKKYEKSNIFSTPDQLRSLKEAALAKELSRVIKAGPDFEDVSVVWTPVSPRRSRSGKPPRVTATVNVKPRHGHELTQKQVHSLRAAVAGMIEDLSPSDVIVFDMATSLAYTADKEGDPYNHWLVSWIREHTRTYEEKIRDSLAYIPGVTVTVNVEVEDLGPGMLTTVNYDPKKTVAKFQSDQTRLDTSYQAPVKAEPGADSNTPKNLSSTAANQKARETDEKNNVILNETSSTTTRREMLPAFPKKVTVAVGIPDEYYRKALEQQTAAGGSGAGGQATKTIEQLRTETETTVKALVAKSIPNGDPQQISVSSIVPVKPDVPLMESSTLDTVTSLVREWGGTAGLAVFALWALIMLRKSLPKGGASDEPALPATTGMVLGGAPSATSLAAGTTELAAASDGPREATERDVLQGMVRDNPEAAAAVLSKWLQAAK